MTGFKADADAIFNASTRFLSMKDYLASVESGLVGDLQTTAGMAGDDAAGRSFAGKYSPAARTAVQAIGVASAGSAAISGRLLTMAWNYLIVDDAAAAALVGRHPQLDSGTAPSPQDCEPGNLHASLPEVQQHHNWAVNHLITPFWPEGDPDKLRNAATTWHKAATLLTGVTTEMTGAVNTMVSACAGVAFDAFYAYADQFVGLQGQRDALLSATATACQNLSACCTAYANHIDARRSDVEHAAEAAGVITGVGVILTIVTLGGSDVAAEALDGAIAAELALGAETFAEGVTADAALAELAEDEAVLENALPKVLLTVPGVMAAPGIPEVTPLSEATGAGTAGSLWAGAPGVGPIGPIPPPSPPFSPLLTGSALAAFNEWFASIPPGPVKPTNPSDRAYQLRVAGPSEYLLPTGVTSGPGQTQAVDGIRPADGALIEAKNVRVPGCTPRTLSGLQNADRVTGFLSPGDGAELTKYGQVLAYPGTQARYLELDTNDPEAVGYWQFLAAEQGVKTNVRYVP